MSDNSASELGRTLGRLPARIEVTAQACPGCQQAAQAISCVLCGQLQDPVCGYGTSYTPSADGVPGQWRCSDCQAVIADEVDGGGPR